MYPTLTLVLLVLGSIAAQARPSPSPSQTVKRGFSLPLQRTGTMAGPDTRPVRKRAGYSGSTGLGDSLDLCVPALLCNTTIANVDVDSIPFQSR
jgi:hypothetical protein